MPFGANDVASQVEFPTNLSRSIHSDPKNEIISYFLIDPSEDFQFLVSIQLQNLVFDLCGIHTFFISNPVNEYRLAQSLAPILF
jgi:hypothetical protein